MSLERRLREHRVLVFQHLWGRKKEDGDFLFTRGHMGTSSREKGFMLI